MNPGDVVVLRRELRTPIGWFARGTSVAVLIDSGGTLLICTDLDHHPGNHCHAERVLRKDVIPQ